VPIVYVMTDANDMPRRVMLRTRCGQLWLGAEGWTETRSESSVMSLSEAKAKVAALKAQGRNASVDTDA
jgi:hypothetical protein